MEEYISRSLRQLNMHKLKATFHSASFQIHTSCFSSTLLSAMSRRKLYLNKVTVSLSCGCMKPKLSDIFNPKPKISVTKQSKYPTTSQSHCSYYDNESPNMKSPLQASVGGRFGRTGGEGVAVEKDSDDPYLDFKHSMLQMILENEIYTKDDLRELLNCFLQLNSPYHHGIIIRAFSEIWNGVFYASPSVKRVRRSKAAV